MIRARDPGDSFRLFVAPLAEFFSSLLKDRKLYAIEKATTYPLLEPLIGGTIDTTAVTRQWPLLMRLKASIDAGTVLPSTILRKLAAAGPGNALSQALRAIGRIERTLFTLQWLSLLPR